MLIPPSIALVIYGIIADVNIGALLVAGVIPGIIVTIAIILTVTALVWHNPSLAPVGTAYTLKEKLHSLRTAGPLIVLLMLVTGTIYSGIATPTEAFIALKHGADVLKMFPAEQLGCQVVKAWRAVIAAVALLTAGFASQLPELVIDGSDHAFLHETDPVRTTFEAYREQFGHENTIAIAIRAPQIFDLRFLEKLRAFHRDLERELPQVEEVTSLINARYTHGLEDELVVEDLLEEWPVSAADLAQLEARGLAATVAILPDHPTPVETGQHGRDPVPVAIRRPGEAPAG